MNRIYMLFFAFFLFIGNLVGAQTGQQLANFLGTGSNPRLQLQLSANGPGWGSFTIDYAGVGGVPWSGDPTSTWSTWNVIDTASPSNYYGTITLTSDGYTVAWDSYTPGTNGYYLNDIAFAFNNGIEAYQLTVASIVTPTGTVGGVSGTGPFINAPTAIPAVYPGTSNPIVLSVVGDQIMDNKGNPVRLKGLARPSLEWSVTGQYLSTQDLSNIANWPLPSAAQQGIINNARSNVIRLDLNQDYWLDSQPSSVIGSYQQIINAIVYYSTQLGMAVVLDLHLIGGAQAPMANSDSITFWTQVATEYASFGTVLFELYNEPYGITQAQWLNGGGGYVGYQQLYNAVRATGAQNICIIGGLDYAYDLSFVSPSFCVTGTNIVYCSHPYNQKGQPGYTGEGGTFAECYAGVIGNFPLIMTEFGTNQASYYPTFIGTTIIPPTTSFKTIYENILSYVNANNVHYTAFAWWVQQGDPQFPALIADWMGTPLYGGALVRRDLKQNPGTVVAGIQNAFVTFESRSDTLIEKVIRFDARKFGTGLFCWDFGDASGTCTASPQTSHAYANAGTYVVKLTTIIRGMPFTTSKIIQIAAAEKSSCTLVCPPRDVKVKTKTTLHRNAINTITWKGPELNSLCSQPAYYQVFKDPGPFELIATVIAPNKNGVYQVKDKTRLNEKTTYAVVAVDANGNASLPVLVKAGFRDPECGCI